MTKPKSKKKAEAPDMMTLEAATDTAAKLRAYWHALGHKSVATWVERMDGANIEHGLSKGIFVVRSNIAQVMAERGRMKAA